MAQFSPQLSLVLPFALPPPELAADLTHALKTPALAALISRTSSVRHVPFAHATRALPHELFMAQSLAPGARTPLSLSLATSAMHAMGLDPQDGLWFIVNPAHVQIGRNHLLMTDQRQLRLSDADSRTLFAAAQACAEEAGMTLLYGQAQTWFLRADAWTGLDAATPDFATGQNLSDAMAQGASAKACRKLQNEVQMVWFEHPVNLEREARGLAAVNTLWPWGGADAGPSAERAAHAGMPGAMAGTMTNAMAASNEAPAWLRALCGAESADLSPERVFDGGSDTVVYCDQLSGPALAADWSSWLQQMHALEQDWFAPVLARLSSARLARVQLVLSHRDAHLELSTTPMAQRKFWRRPTLKRLLP